MRMTSDRNQWREALRSLPLLSLLFVLGAAGCEEPVEPDDEVLPPIASAGANHNIPLGEVATLSGSGSRDPQFLYLSYSWEFLSRPAGSTAVLEHANEPIATFVPDVEGLYRVVVTVSNGHLEDADTVRLPTAPDIAEVFNNDVVTNTTLTNVYANPYAVDYILSVPVEVLATLTVQEGVRIETRGGTTLTIGQGGSLHVAGSADEPVVFAGMKERQGYWRGIEFLDGSVDNDLVHVEVANGGGPVPDPDDPPNTDPDNQPLANLYIRAGAAVSASNSLFRKSASWGVFVEDGGSFLGTDNTFQNNELGAVSP